ncbi:MAG: peptidylprolyl isomerase [Tidjanibacter sp.]|nr:peptidylprolyl isomerase [Tidjanibacter sp.]
MKVLKKAVLTLGCIFAFFTYGVQAQQRVIADKIVAVIGNSAVLYSEVQTMADQLQAQYREQGFTPERDLENEALEKLMLQKLLYNQALLDSVVVNETAIATAVEEQVNKLIEQEGSIAALEKKQHKQIYEIRDDIYNSYLEGQYAQVLQYQFMDEVKITPGEVDSYYRNISKDELPIIPEQYIYAQITKFPSSMQDAKQRTRERLLEMRERVIGGTAFETLARMYSVDTNSAMQGGDIGYMTLDALVPTYSDAIRNMQVGQISGVVETEYGFHIIKLTDKKGDQYRTSHILIRPSYTTDEINADLRSLDSLATVIRADSISFAAAALQHSDDKYSRQNEGIVTNHEMLEYYGASDASYSSTKWMKEDLGADYDALRLLKVGDISPAFRSQDLHGNVLCKIVKLVEVIPSHTGSLANDYLSIEQAALQDKQQKEFQKWVNEKIEGMYVKINADFTDLNQFENKTWLK